MERVLDKMATNRDAFHSSRPLLSDFVVVNVSVRLSINGESALEELHFAKCECANATVERKQSLSPRADSKLLKIEPDKCLRIINTAL